MHLRLMAVWRARRDFIDGPRRLVEALGIYCVQAHANVTRSRVDSHIRIFDIHILLVSTRLQHDSYPRLLQ